MTFHTLQDAKEKNLSRLTQWLYDTPDERCYLEDANSKFLLVTPNTVTLFVRQGSLIALFVKKEGSSNYVSRGPQVRLSKSKKYKSIRHLAEKLFSNNPNLSIEDFKSAMKKEYPKSSSAGIKCYGHYLWYRHHLVKQGRFRCIPRPEWFKA